MRQFIKDLALLIFVFLIYLPVYLVCYALDWTSEKIIGKKIGLIRLISINVI